MFLIIIHYVLHISDYQNLLEKNTYLYYFDYIPNKMHF